MHNDRFSFKLNKLFVFARFHPFSLSGGRNNDFIVHLSAPLQRFFKQLRLCKNHSSGRSLKNARHDDVNVFADIVTALFHNDHRAVIEIGYALIVLFSILDDKNFHFFPWQDNRLDGRVTLKLGFVDGQTLEIANVLAPVKQSLWEAYLVPGFLGGLLILVWVFRSVRSSRRRAPGAGVDAGA